MARTAYNLVSTIQIYIFSTPHVTNISYSSSGDVKVGTIEATLQIDCYHYKAYKPYNIMVQGACR
jgi:hypothetical protein